MLHDLFILITVLMGFAVAWPLRIALHDYVSPAAKSLLGRLALMALYGHAAIFAASTFAGQAGSEAIRTQIQELQARTAVTAEKVKASKAAIVALGPKPAVGDAEQLRVWQSVRSVLDSEVQINGTSVDRLVKDMASLNLAQRELTRVHEARIRLLLSALGAALISVFAAGMYRATKQEQAN